MSNLRVTYIKSGYTQETAEDGKILFKVLLEEQVTAGASLMVCLHKRTEFIFIICYFKLLAQIRLDVVQCTGPRECPCTPKFCLASGL